MNPIRQDIIVVQGATYDGPSFIWETGTVESSTPTDLTGATARMLIKKSLQSDVVIAELTTANGGIVLGGLAGTIEIVMSAAMTAAFCFSSAIYQLEIYQGASTTRFAQGSVTLDAELVTA